MVTLMIFVVWICNNTVLDKLYEPRFRALSVSTSSTPAEHVSSYGRTTCVNQI